MGGAVASLGADLASMQINPAGMGMYQTSDWGLTTALSYDRTSTVAPGMAAGDLTAGGGRLSAGVNNFGVAFNLFNGSGGLTSVTIGFGYNRMANFNSRTRTSTRDEDASISQVFARQLDYRGYEPGELDPDAYPFDNLGIGLEQWGAVLGYQTGLVGQNDLGGWGHDFGSVPSDAHYTTRTRGGVYRYDFSMGFNLSNIVYLGASLGLTDINYDEQSSYEEAYADSYLGGMRFDQSSNIRGTGGNVTLGAVVRPVEALRIGVAFHSPSFLTLEKRYNGYMETGRYWAETGDLSVSSRLTTAPRLVAGVSGVVGGRAIVALDWERTWYNKVRERDNSAALAASERNNMPSNTFRAGLEVRLTDALALRAGGSWMADFLRDKGLVANNPTVRSGFSVTTGAGFSLGEGGYLDVAYVYNRARMTDYDLYYFDADHIWTGQYNGLPGGEVARTYTPTRHRHMLTLTLGQRF
jgi:hypothetical protein